MCVLVGLKTIHIVDSQSATLCALKPFLFLADDQSCVLFQTIEFCAKQTNKPYSQSHSNKKQLITGQICQQCPLNSRTSLPLNKLWRSLYLESRKKRDSLFHAPESKAERWQ